MTDTPNTARYLRTEQAAGYCGSTKSTFEKLRVVGRGAPFSKLGKTVVYAVEDLDAWIAERRFRSTAEADAARQADAGRQQRVQGNA